MYYKNTLFVQVQIVGCAKLSFFLLIQNDVYFIFHYNFNTFID